MQFSRTERISGIIIALAANLALGTGVVNALTQDSDNSNTIYTPEITDPITPNPELTLPLNVRLSTRDTEEKKIELLNEKDSNITKDAIKTWARIAYGEARGDGQKGMQAVAASLYRRYEFDNLINQNYQGKRVFSDPSKPVTLENIATYEKKEIPQYNALRDSTLLTTPREKLEQESIDLAYEIVLDVLSGTNNPYSNITHFESGDEEWEGREVAWLDHRTRCENKEGPNAGKHQTYSTVCETLKKGHWTGVELP
jgi:hypothetical protein